MGEFVPADVAFFVVSHIERSEESVSEVFVLTVGFVHLVGLNFLLSSVVNERNGVAVDTDVVNKGLEVTMGSVVNVLEDTVLEHGVLLLHVVGLYFFLYFVSDDVLVSEHVSDLAFVDGHATLISPVHGAAGMAVPVLHVVVLFFGELGELDLALIRGSRGVDSLTAFFTSSGSSTCVILKLVEEGVLLEGSEASQERHKRGEGGLVVL